MIFSRRDIAPPVREQEIIVAVGNCEMEMVTSCVALYDGVPEMLRELQNMGFRMAVCSNGGPAYFEHVLKKTGIDCFFCQGKRHPIDRCHVRAWHLWGAHGIGRQGV